MSVDALAEPTARVRGAWTAGLSTAILGIYIAFMTPIQILLPMQLADVDPSGKIAALGWVTGVGALVAVVVNPLAGALSDRTTGRFGRRHPWTVAGVALGAAGLVFTGFQSTTIGVLIGWCLAQAGLNAAYASLNAAVPDRVPVRQRAAVSGWIGIPQPLGLVVGALLVTLLVTTTAAGYGLVAVAVVVGALPFVLASRDAPLPRTARQPLAIGSILRGLWINPRRHPDFGWAWLTRFLVMLGNSTGTLYLLYFLDDAVGYERLFPGHSADEGVLILTVVYTVGVIATAVVGGVVSDRSGRRRLLVMVSCVVMTVAAIMLMLWHTWPVAIAAAFVLGAGFGVYLAVDQALITQVLPTAADRGKDLGVINIANSAPQVLGPALAAPVVAGLGGYTGLYGLTAALTILGGVLVWKIKGVR
ncbi:MFS transporter [Stackebrandtia soli]|uniref:MFS transporter n=1 Tax=Stackebrandtia soli TaxID=1892856 RepID=UPI0039EBEE2C